MADVDVLSARVEADVSQFMAGMNAVIAATQQAAQAHEDSASSIGLAVEGYHLAAEAVMKVVEGLKEFADTAIEANNAINPEAAQQWNLSVRDLHDSFSRFAGALGAQVEPAVEHFMGSMADAFKKLASLDWGAITGAIEEIFKNAGESLKKWAGPDLADTLTWPFRTAFGIIEAGIGKLLEAFGSLANGIGDVLPGLVGRFSGDAFAETGKDLERQAKAIATSYASASAEIGKGLNDSLNAAIDATGSGPAMKRLRDAIAGVGATSVGGRITTAEDVQREAGGQNAIEQAANQYERIMGRSADKLLKTQLAVLDLQEQADAGVVKSSDYAFAQAQKSYDDAVKQNDTGGMALALQRMSATAAQVKQAFEDSGVDLNKQIALVQAALDAQQAKAASTAAAAAEAELQKVKDLQALEAEGLAPVIRARLQADSDHQSAIIRNAGIETQLVTQLQAQKDALTKKSIDEETNARIEAQKHIDEMNKISTDAWIKELTFYQSTAANLGKGALGSVGGSAVSAGVQGFEAGGPVGAAAGALSSLLEASQGFKDLSASVSKIFQSLADTVGSVLEPLVPVIDEIGEALKPLFSAVSGILKPIGAVAASVLKPFVDLIKELATPLEAVLKPIGDLLAAVGPLIGPIEEMSILIFEITNLFDPVTLALEALAPALDWLAQGIRVLVSWIADVWNGILGVLESVLDELAHALPSSLGDAMRSLDDQLHAMEINASGFDSSMNAATTAVTTLASAATQTGTAMGLVGEAVLEFASTAAQVSAALGGTDAGGVNGLVAQLLNQYENATDSLSGSTSGKGGFAGVSSSDQAAGLGTGIGNNTVAVSANTKAVTSLNATLTDMVTGFRLGKYEYNASAPDPKASTRAQVAGLSLATQKQIAATRRGPGSV